MTLSPEMNNPVQSGPPAPPASYPPPPPYAPAMPAQAAGRKVSAPWTGALMALGTAAAAVAAFLPFEKIVALHGPGVLATVTFTGVGSKSATGVPIPSLTAGNGGRIILASAVVALLCGLAVLLGKGRLWASIVGLVAVSVGGLLAVATFAAATDDQKKLNANSVPGLTFHALTKLGPVVAAVGFGVAALGAILAICVRRRRAV